MTPQTDTFARSRQTAVAVENDPVADHCLPNSNRKRAFVHSTTVVDEGFHNTSGTVLDKVEPLDWCSLASCIVFELKLRQVAWLNCGNVVRDAVEQSNDLLELMFVPGNPPGLRHFSRPLNA